VANLDVCDRLLLLAPGGSMAYFGPPAEALSTSVNVTSPTWLLDLAALAAVMVLFLAATALLLRRLDPRRQ
jgi:membrane protein implicated in regulation of membrane protease activity